ncbi:helix-turn-helix domain-containing protein [Rhizobium leucaenae]|uniref:helix-turn-helix domain-containing protein n=1 Tax=Rhizobium leucaenae TaxID=29450 RepID=UPI00160BDA42|nr:helix-turn-helix transcriptional regulator [Rhizobium leucaenae]
MSLTAGQCRAARGLIGWPQSQLSEASKVSPATIANFESGKRVPIANNLAAIRTALTAAGVTFLDAGDVASGPGVSLRASGIEAVDVDETQVIQFRENLVNDAPPGAGG